MANAFCIRAIVSGKVQGVFYRKSTCEKARELNLVGWVKNLDNNDVELIACGEEPQVRQLLEWLHQGPPRAKVTQVNWTPIPPESHPDFKTR